jgi:hypothetical protein
MKIKKIILFGTFLTLAPFVTYADVGPEVNCDTLAIPERNWSMCDKRGKDYSGRNIMDSIFHGTIFKNANLKDAILAFSDFSGADFGIGPKKAIYVGANFEFSIWTNGHLCDENSIGMCNEMTLDETYAALLELFDEKKRKGELDWVKYYRTLARNSLNVVLAGFHTTYQQALLAHPGNIDNIEDPISYDELNDNDIVVLLEKSNHHLEAYKIDSFRNYVNSDSFKIRTLNNDVIRIRN